MRFFHLSDLHIGKQLHYYNLKENQRAVLRQIAERVEEYRPDAVLICGDIFDKSVPSGEAYMILDEFLALLAELEVPVLIIAGNHDNPQRLSYAGGFLEKHRIFLSVFPPRKEEHLKKVVLTDQWGPVNFYLLPFLKPGYIRQLFEEGVINDYHSAVRELLIREHLDSGQIEKGERNVLLSHQFYVNGGEEPQRCESEQLSVQMGGLDSVDASLIEHFDYAALGHIHGSQKVKHSNIRYCGTPLKYSVSEEHHKKSITLVTLEEKGKPPMIETIPLMPIQDVRREEGLLSEILERAGEENRHDFVSVTITDEREPHHPMEQLEEKYDHILELRVDNRRTRAMTEMGGVEGFCQSPSEVFAGFYQEMRGQPMSPEEEAWMQQILESEGEERL